MAKEKEQYGDSKSMGNETFGSEGVRNGGGGDKESDQSGQGERSENAFKPGHEELNPKVAAALDKAPEPWDANRN